MTPRTRSGSYASTPPRLRMASPRKPGLAVLFTIEGDTYLLHEVMSHPK